MTIQTITTQDLVNKAQTVGVELAPLKSLMVALITAASEGKSETVDSNEIDSGTTIDAAVDALEAMQGMVVSMQEALNSLVKS